MKRKSNRLDAIKMIISGKEVGSQEELLKALENEGFEVTQATLSRDLKQLKVAKAANINGKYVYVLPNNIMYKRSNTQSTSEMLMNSGFVSLQFSGNLAIIRTRPGYASSMAYDIDNRGMRRHPGHHSGRRHHHDGDTRRHTAQAHTGFFIGNHTSYKITNM